MAKSKKNIILKILKYFGFLILLLIFFVSVLFIYYARNLPRPEKFTERELIQSTKIYDQTGEILLYDIHGEEKREIVSFDQVPDHLKHAVVTAEDDKFYQHRGLDFKGILRAFLVNIRRGKLVQGGSTITQQLIRSSFLTQEKTLERKIKEMILSLELERRYPKAQILEWYLNQIPLGSNCYGVGAASKTYFNKEISDISLEESAILAALIPAPSYLSPYGPNKNELIERKDYILNRMKSLGYISEGKLKEVIKKEINFVKIKQPIKAPHFVFYIKNYLEKKYGKEFLKHKGLRVYTTLDWNLQKKAEEIIKEEAERIKTNYNAHNLSLVALNPKNGHIFTMVGSKDFFAEPYPKGCITDKNQTCLFEPKFNVATQGNRQPGSAFKPFVYTKAFQKGFGANTLLWDVKTEFNPDCKEDASQEENEYGLGCYHPKNYDEKFRGIVSLRKSLAQSINLPSVKLLYLTGVKESIRTAHNLGITTLNNPSRLGLSLVLGGGEVKLLDLVSAYGVFSQEGLRVSPVVISKIEDSEGNIIEEKQKDAKRVLNTNTARLINNILSDNEARAPMFGFNSPLYFKENQVAAKTGTTQFFNDAWTIGYTPSFVVGVWVGNNDNSSMAEEPAIKIAGPTWRKFMLELLKLYPKQKFKNPGPVSSEKLMLGGDIDKKEPHTILYYIKKEDPTGPVPKNPEEDPQYSSWETGLKNWLKENSIE